MRVSQDGIELVKQFEGLYLHTYTCPAGKLTIGYGHTGPDVYVGKTITETEANDLLKTDLNEAGSGVIRYVSVDLSQNQFDALTSFVFNIGINVFRTSTLLSLLNSGSYNSVPIQLTRWVHGGGKVLPGLVKRRKAEGALWSNQNTNQT